MLTYIIMEAFWMELVSGMKEDAINTARRCDVFLEKMQKHVNTTRNVTLNERNGSSEVVTSESTTTKAQQQNTTPNVLRVQPK